MSYDIRQANEETRAAWNANAGFWDGRMGEGNDWVETLVWPATVRLLQVQPGECVLDVACGNGLASRRLAAMGADVVAFDFSTEMIAHARRRTIEGADRITYHVMDATDEASLLALGERQFDAALCSMALFDIADIDPLARALARLLRPGGCFVFSVLHPCFNGGQMALLGELEDREGQILTVYSVKVWGYIEPQSTHGVAMAGQPKPHLYFHRPLQVLFGTFLQAGFALDGLEEPTFPADHPPGRHALSWGGNFHHLPPLLVARMRLAAR